MATAADPGRLASQHDDGGNTTRPHAGHRFEEGPGRGARPTGPCGRAPGEGLDGEEHAAGVRGGAQRLRAFGRPETDAGVAAYLGDLYEEGLSAACAAMAVAAIRFRARLAPGLPGGGGHGAGAGRLPAPGFGARPRPGDRVRWEQADRAASMAERSGSLAGLRDAAIISVASDALLGCLEISALDVIDVHPEERTVLVRRSKTDQEGEGAVQFWARRPWSASGPGCWAPPSRRGRSSGPSTARAGCRRGACRTEHPRHHHPPRPDAGVKGRISGHSLRVGGAQSLASAGASLSRCSSPAAGARSHAGALRAGPARPARRGGEAALRFVRERLEPTPLPPP